MATATVVRLGLMRRRVDESPNSPRPHESRGECLRVKAKGELHFTIPIDSNSSRMLESRRECTRVAESVRE